MAWHAWKLFAMHSDQKCHVRHAKGKRYKTLCRQLASVEVPSTLYQYLATSIQPC